MVNGRFQSAEVREARRQRLAGYEKTFLQFQIPVAALPKTVSLAQVCEIFEVLNQTGTKVSSFDLVHNNNYAYREMFECLAKDSDPEEFWNMRASLLAERLHALQYVARG